MSDISDWIQSYWFELSTLTTQIAILAVLVWYARTTLRILTVSQPQAEPTASPSVAPPSFVPAEPPHTAGHGGVGRMLSPIPTPQPESAVYARAARTNPLRAVIKWLQAPMTTRAGVPWRRVTRIIS